MAIDKAQREAHGAVMAGLRDKLTAIHGRIPVGSEIVYIDYPVHFNVGDQLIHLGTEQFFADSKYKVVGRFSAAEISTYSQNTRELRLGRSLKALDDVITPGRIIALHGGGNLGDIWPEHQLLREAIIRRYPKSQIVFLPQSIHFADAAFQERSAKIMRQHGGVSCFVRDEESLPFVRDQCGIDGGVVPDMAHQLWEHLRVAEPEAGAGPLWQVRRDIEKVDNAPGATGASFDWDDLIGIPERIELKLFQATELMGPWVHANVPTDRLWYRTRDAIVGKALPIFARHPEIVTNRLHGLILGSLLSRKVSFTDNTYGKLSRYHAAWLKDSPLVRPYSERN